MNTQVFKAFLLIIGILFVVFTASFMYISNADADNETSVQNATRNAMTQAVNLGSVRVNEEITINKQIAEEAVIRQYADNVDFFDGDRYLNIYDISTGPPMLAVEAYTKIKTPFMGMANVFSKENHSSNTTTRSREIVIYEAKDLKK